MEVVYNYDGLIDVELDDDIIDEKYMDLENNDVIQLIIHFPNFVKNKYIKKRLKKMIKL